MARFIVDLVLNDELIMLVASEVAAELVVARDTAEESVVLEAAPVSSAEGRMTLEAAPTAADDVRRLEPDGASFGTPELPGSEGMVAEVYLSEGPATMSTRSKP